MIAEQCDQRQFVAMLAVCRGIRKILNSIYLKKYRPQVTDHDNSTSDATLKFEGKVAIDKPSRFWCLDSGLHR